MSPKRKNKIRLSALDKRILNRLQEDIPFVSRPWQAVAGELGIKEELLLKRIGSLKDEGIIRRISAGFAPRKIKYVSTLVGVKVSPAKCSAVAKRINVYPEVTHNYKRNAEYNIWFTLVAKDRKRILSIIGRLKEDPNIQRITEFPAGKLFKINVKLKA